MSGRVQQRGSTILLLKLTPGEQQEARALGRSVADLRIHPQPIRRDVLVVRDARRADTIRLAGEAADLRTRAGRWRFTRSLGLDRTAAEAVEALLEHAEADTRDELAQLTRALCWASQGRIRIDRLVISGHYSHAGVRGNRPDERGAKNGALPFAALRRLVALFPAAAGQVRHLLLSICFAGAQRNPTARSAPTVLESYRAIFPALQSVTGYRARSPISGQGAERHLGRWARATRRGESPARAQLFGRCARQTPLDSQKTSHRNHFGVVHTDRGVDQCR